MQIVQLMLVLLFLISVPACNDDGSERLINPLAGEVTPESQGLSSLILLQGMLEADEAGFVDALLVIRNGHIVAERYFNGYDSTSTHNVMSVSKSFLSAIAGLALRDGYLDSLDQLVLPYFLEFTPPGMDPQNNSITLRHLLTMRMGIANEESNYFTLYNSDNWITATLAHPFVAAPGEEFHYNTFGTHLLSALITRAAGQDTKTFAESHLLEPLGITVDEWQCGPQGYYFGGNSMHFTPREMAQLGLLWLEGGKKGEVQIVPEDWVAYTITPSTNFGNSSWGPMTGIQYGALWWLGTLNQRSVFMAIGHGGQYVVCVPSLNLVAVSTSNNHVDWDTADAQERAVLQIISSYVLGAIEN